MAEGTATRTFTCTAEEYLAFVLDVERYRQVDDKLGTIDWVRTEGNVTEFRFRPKMPLMPWSPKVVSRMTLTPGQRIDIEYAPKPNNRLAHALSTFSAFFEVDPADEGIRVTRSVNISLPRLLRPIEGSPCIGVSRHPLNANSPSHQRCSTPDSHRSVWEGTGLAAST